MKEFSDAWKTSTGDGETSPVIIVDGDTGELTKDQRHRLRKAREDGKAVFVLPDNGRRRD